MKSFYILLYYLLFCIPTYIAAQCTVTINSTGSLCEGQNIALTATATGTTPILYQWQKDGSDLTGSTDVACNVSAAGNYDVIITDNASCTNTSNIIIIHTIPPVPGFIMPPTACGNINFNFTGVSPNNMASYSWTFGDGTGSNIQFPSHSFKSVIGDTVQTFIITLTIADSNGCSNSFTQPITVKQVPDTSVTDASPNQLGQFIHCNQGVTSCNLIINNNSKTINSNYNIDWGDGSPHYNSPSLPNGTQHSYTNRGEYTIVYSVSNNSGCTSVKTINYFCGSNPAGAIGSPGNTSGCAPISFTFPISGTDNNTLGTIYKITYTDTAKIDYYNQPPPASITHTYKKTSCSFNPPFGEPNSFMIVMTISNPCGNSQMPVLNIHIGDKPTVNFTFNTPVCINTTTTFTNKSTDCNLKGNGTKIPDVNFIWKILPATGWTALNPLNSTNLKLNFTQTGTYSVQLFSSNPCGKDSITQTISVSEPPKADATPNFISNQGNNCTIPFQVTFANNSIGPGLSYTWSVTSTPPIPGSWNFVNPDNANSASPIINFSQPGTYTVTLKAANICGNDSKNFIITIYGSPTVDLLSFSACPNKPVDLSKFVSYTNIPSINSYTWNITPSIGWNFVAPTTSSTNYPNINFTLTGNYSISVKISSNTCPPDSASQNIIINDLPTVSITQKDTTICPGNNLVFTLNTTGNNLSYQWYKTVNSQQITVNGATNSTFIINNATLPDAGTYSCVVTNETGCSQTSNPVILTIIQLTTAVSANSAYIANGTSTTLHANITDGSGSFSFYWSPANKLANPSDSALSLNPVTANLKQNTTFTLFVTDNKTKCTSSDTIIIHISGISLNVNLKAAPKIICSGENSQLTATASGGSNKFSYQWSSIPVDPNLKCITFAKCDTLTVTPTLTTTYTVTVNDGFTSVTGTVIITVIPSPDPSFTYDAPCSEKLTGFIFNGSPKNNVSAFWDFGDSDFSDSISTHHYYRNFGNFKVSLTIIDSNGCKATSSKLVTVNEGIKIDFISDSVCFGDSTGLNHLILTPGHNINKYEWTDENNKIIIGTKADILYKFLSDGIHLIQLKAIDDKGCSDSIIHNVIVYKNPEADFKANTAILGNPTNFFDESSNGSGKIYQWHWNFGVSPPNNTSDNQNCQHLYSSIGNYNVTLLVKDNNGCMDSVKHTIIVQSSNLHSDFKIVPSPACESDIVHFTDISTGGNVTINDWLWYFGDISSGLNDTSHLQNPTHVFIKAGTYFINLKISSNGISDSSQKMIIVYPNPVAGFTANPTETTILKPLITFNNISVNSVKCIWNFGDITFDSICNTTEHKYKNPGIFKVTQYVYNNYGCKDSARAVIKIDEVYKLYLPSAFVPNKPGNNSVFYPKGIGIDENNFQMWIFDRWSTEIYYTKDFNKGWNGKLKNTGRFAPEGIYICRIILTDFEGNSHTIFSKITVLN